MLAARELRNCGDENQRALRSKSTCASKTTSVHKYGDAATLSVGRNPFLPAKLQIAGFDISRSGVSKIEARLSYVDDKTLLYLAEVLKVQLQELFPTRPPGNRIYDFIEKLETTRF